MDIKDRDSAMYKIIFDDGEIRILVAKDLSFEECLELQKKQVKPECYEIIAM